jgi:plastocyanin
MGIRRSCFLLVCALLGAAVAVLPAVAGSETSPSIQALDSIGVYNEQRHSWSPSEVTLSPGGSVVLSNPSGEVKHGVEWRGTVTPSCSEGVPVGTTAAASATRWSGTCTFAQPGTYVFYCTVHGYQMTGTVRVSGAGAPTGTLPGTTGTSSGTPPPGGSGSAQPPAVPVPSSAGPAAVSLARGQRGSSVRGSIAVPATYAGGRLEVDLLAPRAALAAAGRPASLRVGRFLRSALPIGRLTFRVPLAPPARRALAHHRRLTLTVRIRLTPPHGAALSASRRVVLHA